MNTRTFFVGRAIVFLGIMIIVLGVVVYTQYFAPNKNTNEPAVSTTETLTPSSEPTAFAWKFEEDDSLNLDGMPQTNVVLEVTYADSSVNTFPVETVSGGCNTLSDSKNDSVAGVPDVQCYAAGLGQRYQLVTTTAAYEVRRKIFEEALPDYESPNYQYETLLTIPLGNTASAR